MELGSCLELWASFVHGVFGFKPWVVSPLRELSLKGLF